MAKIVAWAWLGILGSAIVVLVVALIATSTFEEWVPFLIMAGLLLFWLVTLWAIDKVQGY